MKTNKHQTLLLVKKNGAVLAKDIVNQFDYSPATARSYLSYLTRQDLLERRALGHVLTDKGKNRLHFFEVTGCRYPGCPLCEGKPGHFTCPTCGWRLSKKLSKLRPKWDTLFFKREAGIYCPRCQNQIFTQDQAHLMKILEKTK